MAKKPAKPQTRRCPSCQGDLPTTDFRRTRHNPSGFARRCRECEQAPAPDSIVYGLVDPRTQTIRYIGVTQDPRQRYSRHLRLQDTPTSGPRARAWIAELTAASLEPTLVKLEQIPEARRQEKEAQWIYFGRSVGWDLVNMVSGRAEAAS